MQRSSSYLIGLIFSLILHGLFFYFLLVNFSLEYKKLPMVVHASTKPVEQTKSIPSKQQDIVKAGLVKQEWVDKALARQSQVEKNRKAQMAKEQKALQNAKKELKLAKEQARKLKSDADAAKIAAQKAAKERKLQEEKTKQAKAAEQALKAKIKAEQENAKVQEQQRLAKQKEEAEKKQQAAQHEEWLLTEFEKHVADIKQAIINNRTLTMAFSEDLECEIQIRLLPDGSVNQIQVIRSSGNEAYDAQNEKAIYKAAPFDMPKDPILVQKLREIVFSFRLEESNVT